MSPPAAESIAPITAAVIGAGGAVLGGFLTAGSNVWAETLRRRHSVEEDARRSRRDARRAARLVSSELARSKQALEVASKDPGHWPLEGQIVQLSTSDWSSFRPLFADMLTDNGWLRLVRAYHLLEVLNHPASNGVLGKPEDFERAIALLGQAIDVVDDVMVLS